MKFSRCTSQCTSAGDRCQGCGRTHVEIKQTQQIVAKLVGHLVDYQYDDPEHFLQMITQKALKRSKIINDKSS
ncbi:DUF1289 domain-containing protein [Psychromonas sp. CNPT3]|uniref:DUF1289 domain-containing protein n=1 Tax=Psychromonas sp. CNPT3 TaxID=314282 RepID=UPI0003225081|nr:DUF1289 domain-containing protein [Psychromonas sp. CNPT3]